MEYMAAQMDRQIEGAQHRYDDALKEGEQPAFPIADYDHQTFMPETVDEAKRLLSGMSLRDYFSAKAMNGICAHHDTWGLTEQEIADHAYRLADAMLAARAKP
ncbi:hypothetical protein [Pseudomonas vranovensis]|uniref:hypothetical protein n=1 Tax=Pseudomonas vranovensis TaxID=321661 RepID=UPI00041012EC|nr:hypothetical protein [Pseudomonas vranovensis]